MSERALGIVRSVVLFDGVCLVAAFFVAVDLGGEVRGAVHGSSPLGALLAIVIWTGPFVVHHMKVRTPLITVLGGIALLGATGALLVALFRSRGLDAGVAVVMLGLLLYAAGGTLWYLDTTARRLAARDAGAHGPET